MAEEQQKKAKSRTTLEKWLLGIVFVVFLLLIAATVLIAKFATDASAAKEAKKAIDEAPKVCVTAGCVQAASYLMSSINSTADPCDNFFEYACGKFNHDHPIPEESFASSPVFLADDKVTQQLRDLLESKAIHAARSVEMAKTAYKICMNEGEIEKFKSKPLLDAIKTLGSWPLMLGDQLKNDEFNLTFFLANASTLFENNHMFQLSVEPDFDNSTKYIMHIDQAKLSFGSLQLFENSEFIQKLAMISKVVVSLVGNDPTLAARESVATGIAKVIEFERRIARILTPSEMQRNQTRERKTVQELYELLPQIEWLPYIKLITPVTVHDIITNSTVVAVREVEYLQKLSGLLSEFSDSPNILVDHTIWRLVLSLRTHLDQSFTDLFFSVTREMTGQQRESPRWQTCVRRVEKFFPLAVGAIYVENIFDKNGRREATAMFSNIRNAFIKMVDNYNWMERETKKITMEKAKAIKATVGYPEFILDATRLDNEYDSLAIDSNDSYFGMVLKLQNYHKEKAFNMLKKPVIREGLHNSPASLGAFYSPRGNSISIAAAILQPPAFSSGYPKSLNYGAIGSIIGHEITHGFDDTGSQFDKNGNVVNWWDERSAAAFKKRTECMIKQYGELTVPGINLKVNGINTLGENIADNGGIKESYAAYRALIENAPEPQLPGLPDLTSEQLFFLGYATITCGRIADAAARVQVMGDPHSPNLFRVNTVMANFPAFSEAFKCPSGSKMNPVNKCTVW